MTRCYTWRTFARLLYCNEERKGGRDVQRGREGGVRSVGEREGEGEAQNVGKGERKGDREGERGRERVREG